MEVVGVEDKEKSLYDLSSGEESFIILGPSSPQSSLDAALMDSKYMQRSKGSGSSGSYHSPGPSTLNGEMSVPAFKPFITEETVRHQTNLMMNSAMSDINMTDLVGTEIADVLKENAILKQTLAKNNAQMKEEFKKIAEWQDDMMNTQQLHKIKFGETKVLIEKLRMEKAELKKKLECESHLNEEFRKQVDHLATKLQVAEKEIASVKCDCNKLMTERDTLKKDINEINADLGVKISKLEKALHEKSKMQNELEVLKKIGSEMEITETEVEISGPEDSFVITEAVQNGSSNSYLESIVESLTLKLEMVEKQRRQVLLENDKICNEKEKLEENATKLVQENDDLKLVIQGVENKMKKLNANQTKSIDDKLTPLQEELKATQEKLSVYENEKLEYVQQKVQMDNKLKAMSESATELKERLREAHTVAFHPVRYSLSLESQCDSSEFSNFLENVKLYDKTLKELAQHLNHHSQIYAELFNKVNNCLVDMQSNNDEMKADQLVQIVVNKVHDVTQTVNGYNIIVLDTNNQVKASLNFLEKLFLDYQQVLKINKDFEDKMVVVKEKMRTYDQMIATVADCEIQLVAEINKRKMLESVVIAQEKSTADDKALLMAQLEVYKNDFEAERECRTRIGSEKEGILSNMREVQKRNQVLKAENDNLRASRSLPSTSSSSSQRPNSNGDNEFQEDDPPSQRFPCPICDTSLVSVKMLQEHVETCLDTSQQ